MKYWMKFYDKNSREILSISTLDFKGEPLDLRDLHKRFSHNFVRNTRCMQVKIGFLGTNVKRAFTASFRNNRVVVSEDKNNNFYSFNQFCEELNKITKL